MRGKGGSKESRKSLETVLQVCHVWKERRMKEGLGEKNPGDSSSEKCSARPMGSP